MLMINWVDFVERHVVSFPEDFMYWMGFEFLNPPPGRAIKVNAGDIVHIPRCTVWV